MLNPKNTLNIVGGLTRDPEVVGNNGNIIKFGLAVDYAANDKGSDNNSGYFDVTYFVSDNNDFVKRQVSEGKMKKGSQLHILGRLVQDRWTSSEDEGSKKMSKVSIVAEAITYSGSGSGAAGENNKPASFAQTTMPSEF